MLCPVCRTDLAMSERQGIEIEYCPKCRGVWLDRGELDKILERSAREYEQGPLTGPVVGDPSAPSFLPQPGAPSPRVSAPRGAPPSHPGYPPTNGPGYYAPRRSEHHDDHHDDHHGRHRNFLGRLFD
ncbi:zf-TFIIB domain-containing protein (plasmid) [Microvirga sp. VF16]|nr:zf-TFIIB domain-containing protein [Microvirga sp. VF16]